MGAIYCLANEMNKNILTINKAINVLEENLEKSGFHNTQTALFTIASVIVDGMDNLDYEMLTKEEINKIEKQYAKYNIIWNAE